MSIIYKVETGSPKLIFSIIKDETIVAVEMRLDGNDQLIGRLSLDTSGTLSLFLEEQYHDIGIGKTLILKVIQVAVTSGFDFANDKMPAEREKFHQAIDSLTQLGYITKSNGAFSVTAEGEKYLSQVS